MRWFKSFFKKPEVKAVEKFLKPKTKFIEKSLVKEFGYIEVFLKNGQSISIPLEDRINVFPMLQYINSKGKLTDVWFDGYLIYEKTEELFKYWCEQLQNVVSDYFQILPDFLIERKEISQARLMFLDKKETIQIRYEIVDKEDF